MEILPLEKIEKLLQDSSYICGHTPSSSDNLLLASISKQTLDPFPAIKRWQNHINSFSPAERDKWPLGKTSVFSISSNQNPHNTSKPPIAESKSSTETSCTGNKKSTQNSTVSISKSTAIHSKMPPTPRDSESAGDAANNSAENLPQQILLILDKSTDQKLSSLDLAKTMNLDHQKIVGAIKSLLSLGNLIESEQKSEKQMGLSEEGELMVEHGSHEAVLYNAIPPEGIPQADLMKLPNAKIGFSKAMSAGWVTVDKKATGGPKVTRKVESITDSVQQNLILVKQGRHSELGEKEKSEFKKRKLLTETVLKSYIIWKGSGFSTTISKPETDLTPEMIASGSWKTKTFKQYNFDSLGAPAVCGNLHPLLKVRSEFRQIFLEMGFEEMPTNNYVESSFWNFDALFQPQQHPARDAHDTFFISDPAEAGNFPKDYLEKVKKVHSEGGFGSQGYKYDWKIEEAKKNLLRTHTTAVSARMLYKVAQEKPFKPVKFFSIDRVFRNETLDATHLAEFHQVEGVVADRDLSLGHLIGILHTFFKKLGIQKLRFKPAYNPYTEPSMEIFSYHEGLKKWVEIGNSGVFRPEMLLPMGLPEDVTVIAWGLSLERPTMIRYGFDNIRELFGPKVNLKMVQESPICRLDK